MYELNITLDHNAIPYHRTTQGSRWNRESKRYMAWKEFLQREFTIKYPPTKEYYPFVKPIVTLGPWKCDVMITFKGANHGDPDNILKAVNDALFKVDKYVACSVAFQYAKIPALKINIKKYLPVGY